MSEESSGPLMSKVYRNSHSVHRNTISSMVSERMLDTVDETRESSATEPLIPHTASTDINNQGALMFEEFWPAHLNVEEHFQHAAFERFDTLLPRANLWLRENPKTELIKCETVERKICANDDLDYVTTAFVTLDPNLLVYYVKGLRLWYLAENANNAGVIRRPVQIGYRNFTPRCITCTIAHPIYEDLTTLFGRINEMLMDRPLEGRIISIETVKVMLADDSWEGPEVELDRCHWPEEEKRHRFYFTRIFYTFECPAYEQVGATDFLPDILHNITDKKKPARFSTFASIVRKINIWLQRAKEVRVVNIESLYTVFPGKFERVHTGSSFLYRIDSAPLLRFLRIIYVRPKYGLPPDGLYLPKQLNYKTFIPQTHHHGRKSLTPQCESYQSFLARIHCWVRNTVPKIVSAEVLYSSVDCDDLSRRWDEDCLLLGEWALHMPGQTRMVHTRRPLLQTLRLYIDGDYKEPPSHILQNLDKPRESCTLI